MLSQQTFNDFEVIVPDQTPESDRPHDFYKKFKKLNFFESGDAYFYRH